MSATKVMTRRGDDVTSVKMMQALVYGGPGKKSLEQRPRPTVLKPTDAVVHVTKTTIC